MPQLKFGFLAIVLMSCFSSSGQLNPVTFVSTVDAHVSSANPTTNYGSVTPAIAPIWSPSATDYYRYYITFPITGIPSNAVIYKAELKLSLTSETGITTPTSTQFVVNPLISTWDESSVNFNSTYTLSGVSQNSSYLTSSTWRTFNVTSMVQSMVNGSLVNNGFLIRRTNETTPSTQCTYRTGEASSSVRPQLYVEWYYPISITSVTINHASNSIATDGSITPVLSGGYGTFSYKWFNLNTAYSWSTDPTSIGTSLSISTLAPGCYGLKVTSTNNDEFYYAFIVGAKCDPVNLVFHPGPKFLDDVSLTQSTTTFGNGSAILNETGYNGSRETVNLMRFRCWLDPSYTASKADLFLFGNTLTPQHVNPASPTNDAAFYLVNQSQSQFSSWSENFTVYANKPTTVPGQVVNVPPTTSASMNQTLNMASFWNQWKTNNLNNNGMMMQLDAYGNSIAAWQRYQSGDATTMTSRPYIQFQIDQATCDRTSYISFKRELDAGYVSTFQGILKIQFTEEYEQTSGKKVPLKLYDQNHDLKAAIDYNGSAILGKPLLPALNYQFDDNRHILNLSTYSLVNGQFYLLELTKSTGEKEYIRFMYTN
jgi:hypothetical protein